MGAFPRDERAQWHRLIQTNLYGMVPHLCYECLPYLTKHEVSRIVNVTSDAARIGVRGETVYSAAKGGVMAMSKSLAVEFAGQGVRVNVVSPSTTDTPMMRSVLDESQILRRERGIRSAGSAEPAKSPGRSFSRQARRTTSRVRFERERRQPPPRLVNQSHLDRSFMTSTSQRSDHVGRVALVTGASRNIGRAIAIALAENGLHVAVHGGRTPGPADETVAEICKNGHTAVAVNADLSVASEVDTMVAAINSSLGPIDVMINNASHRPQVPFLEMTRDEWRDVMGLTLDGAFYCIRATAPE